MEETSMTKRENVVIQMPPPLIGFFGATSGFSYDVLSQARMKGEDLSPFSDTVLPCDCTE